jgi:membrane protein YqaA with SNARE-associated domain
MDMLESILLPYGYPGLFIASFLASTILPLGSEAFVLLLITKNFNIYYVILVASIGNFLGACTSYYIGFAGRLHVIEKYFGVSRSQLTRAEKWFTKYGSWSLLFTWLPIVGDALPVMAGIMELKFVMFSILVFIGKFLRYAALAYIVVAGKGLL